MDANDQIEFVSSEIDFRFTKANKSCISSSSSKSLIICFLSLYYLATPNETSNF